MKKMNNYQAPMAEVIEINIVSPVLNASELPAPTLEPSVDPMGD